MFLNRTREIGGSVSAAKNLFDLFDRTPPIDKDSTEGQKLVSKLDFIISFMCSLRDSYLKYGTLDEFSW